MYIIFMYVYVHIYNTVFMYLYHLLGFLDAFGRVRRLVTCPLGAGQIDQVQTAERGQPSPFRRQYPASRAPPRYLSPRFVSSRLGPGTVRAPLRYCHHRLETVYGMRTR